MSNTTDAIKILHERYDGDDPERRADLDDERRLAELEALDRVMAEKVMELHWGKRGIYSSIGEELNVWGWLDKDDWPIGLWQPTLRIEQAMECWETFHTKHKPKRYRLNTYTDDNGSVAEIWIGAKLYCRGPLCQSGLAEAICRALKEVMG